MLVNRTKISSLSKLILDLADKNSRINLILEELVQWTEQDLVLYAEQLDIVANFITERYMRSYPLELNVLTDLWDLTQMCDCGAGETSVSIAPNGKIYLCPAFYYADPESCIGSLDDGVQVEGAALLSLERSPYCANCDIHNCRRCKFLNKEMTGEINIPSRIQCRVSYVERNISAQLQQQLMDMQLISPENIIRPVKFNDSLELIVSQSRARR